MEIPVYVWIIIVHVSLFLLVGSYFLDALHSIFHDTPGYLVDLEVIFAMLVMGSAAFTGNRWDLAIVWLFVGSIAALAAFMRIALLKPKKEG